MTPKVDNVVIPIVSLLSSFSHKKSIQKYTDCQNRSKTLAFVSNFHTLKNSLPNRLWRQSRGNSPVWLLFCDFLLFILQQHDFKKVIRSSGRSVIVSTNVLACKCALSNDLRSRIRRSIRICIWRRSNNPVSN
jgi:hypothetical protein